MKTKQLLFITAAFIVSLIAEQANAKIWRVNKLSNYNVATNHWGDNFGGTSINPVFSELSEVMTSNFVSATAGDTIHLEGCPPGSGGSYAFTTITKRLVIIGTGFFLNENPDASNNELETRINRIEFDAGSDSSQLIGVWIYSSGGAGGIIDIGANNILIKRCKIDWGVNFQNGLSDFIFNGNFFDNIVQPTVSSISISAASSPGNLIFNNNIFKKPIILKNGTLIGIIEQCNNNVFDCPAISGSPSLQFNAGECRNNIIKSSGVLVEVNGSNTNFTNNTSAPSSQLLGTDPSNMHASDINSLFVASGTSDGKYMLNSSSGDNIAGHDGTERGVFGGAAITNHYTLSGLPAIPIVYQITTTGITTNNLQVNIQARTIK